MTSFHKVLDRPRIGPSANGSRDKGSRYVVLATCCLSLFVVGMDNSITNVALPAIRAALDASVSQLQWVVDAYLLVLASLLVASGSVADRFGRRRIFLLGLCLFGAGSLSCGLASSIWVLIAFRGVQAVGGSMLNPVALSIIRNVFTDDRERARAVGVWGAVVGLSLAVGPVVGGVLVDQVGWRAVFFINVPVVIVALVATVIVIPESKAVRGRRLDPVGQLVVLGLMFSLVFGIIEGAQSGWASTRVVVAFIVAAVLLATLVQVSHRVVEPLIELALFRRPPFASACAIALLAFLALNGLLLLNSFAAQDVLGDSAVVAGLFVVPLAAAATACSPLAGRLVSSGRARIPLVASGLAYLLGGALLVVVAWSHVPAALLVVPYVVFGVGFGLVNAPITNTAISGLPADRAGVAAGIASTSRQLGAALGTAIIGSIVAATVGGSRTSGTHAFIGSLHVAAVVMAGCGLVIAVLGVMGTRSAASGAPAGIDDARGLAHQAA